MPYQRDMLLLLCYLLHFIVSPLSGGGGCGAVDARSIPMDGDLSDTEYVDPNLGWLNDDQPKAPSFSFDDLAHVKGDSVRPKWNPDVFNMDQLEKEWAQVVEKDRGYSADLKRLAANVQDESDSFAAKSRAMLQKATDFSDLRYGQ